MRVHLETLGCRLNISETEALARRFSQAGHRMVGEGETADLCVVNTCTVTHIADRKSRQAVRRLARTHPGAQIVVTGCYAQMAPEALRRMPEVDLIVSNEDKDRLIEIISNCFSFPGVTSLQPLASSLQLPGSHTRAFLKVQDGCDSRCAFCVIALARGRGRSRPLAEVLAEVQTLLAAGYREIVLSGVHLGSYGHDLGQPEGLARLIRSLLHETPVQRLRLSSLEPWDIEPDFFNLWQDPRLCCHLHLPLQSGCDATLRRMARRTTTAQFAALVEAARLAIPDLSVTTDIMVGFPGESEEEFASSLSFVAGMEFSGLHVFPFSARPGTAAARMLNQVPPEVIRARGAAMREVGTRSGQRFRQGFVGRIMEILWESSGKEPGQRDLWEGLTDNYIRVTTRSQACLRNVVTRTHLTQVTTQGMRGEVVDRGE
jgi:threonylcarbamoyladenosine tRNA methylthiotransferase MtaB